MGEALKRKKKKKLQLIHKNETGHTLPRELITVPQFSLQCDN